MLKRKMKMRSLAMLLALIMALGLAPMPMFAAYGYDDADDYAVHEDYEVDGEYANDYYAVDNGAYDDYYDEDYATDEEYYDYNYDEYGEQDAVATYAAIGALSGWLGSGTATDPYLIGTAEQLLLLATETNATPRPGNNPAADAMPFANVHFRLTADIDLNDLGGADAWPMIGQSDIRTNWVNPNAPQGVSFNGVFDGDWHTITFAHGSLPLFGSLWSLAQVRNLNIYGPYIAGNGLIDWVVVQQGFGNPHYILIDDVTILSGTTIRGSGFAGTDGFRPQQLDIRNSLVESGVRIGWSYTVNGPFDQNLTYFFSTAGSGPGVGSFVSGLAGSIYNSYSYATVYGHANVVNVGGLVGYKQQSMRSFQITNSHFRGEIIAPHSLHVGGILGAGYDSPNPVRHPSTPRHQLGGFMAAPNTPGADITGSTVDAVIIGYRNVGGIVGGEFANQTWATGGPEHILTNNHFEGTLTAMAANANVGGIFGYVRSLNRNNIITGNTFDTDCVDVGIGFVSIVDTIHADPTPVAGTIYFRTQGTAAENPPPAGFGGITRRNYYRTDDPLGEDAHNLAKPIGDNGGGTPPLTLPDAVTLIENHNFVPVVQVWVGTSAANTRNAAIAAVRTQVENLLDDSDITVTNVRPQPDNLTGLPNPVAAGNALGERLFRATITDGTNTSTADFLVDIEFLHQAATGITVTMPINPDGNVVGANATTQFTSAILPAAIPQGVTWGVTGHAGASINASGLLTVGNVPVGTPLTVTATRVPTQGDPTELYAYIVVTVVAALHEWVGSGTLADPFLLSTAVDFELLSYRTNNALPSAVAAFSGVHFRMTNNVSLPADWTPIGLHGTAMNRVFAGTFDGGGYTLTYHHGSRALFGAVHFPATIRNLYIFGTYIADNGLISGLGPTMPANANRIIIDNVNITSGTTTRRSGLVSDGYNRVIQVTISNSTVYPNVRIGWSMETNAPTDHAAVGNPGPLGAIGVGSFISGLNGEIINSVSYATVYGQNNVGGLAGHKSQSVRPFLIENSHFRGTINATGVRVGGLVGSGYRHSTAPNAPAMNIIGSSVTGTVRGYDMVGGIVGAEGELINQVWNNGIGNIIGNHFGGTLIADAANARNVGGLIGYIRSLNRYTNISDNTFAYGSAARGIGHITLIDTIHANPTEIDGVIYFNTQGTAAENPPPAGFGGIGRRNHFRTDDPLGANLEALVRAVDAPPPVDRTALIAAIAAAQARNQANYTPHSWGVMQTALATAIAVRDNNDATQGEVATAADGLTAAIAALVLVSGGGPGPDPVNPRVHIAVLNPNARSGDPTNFLAGTYVYIAANETAYSILRRAEFNLQVSSRGHHVFAGMYVEGINGWYEFDGGPLSGWMYVVNGVFPEFSASLYYLQDGDRLYWLYTYELGQDLIGWGAGSTFANRYALNAEIARANARSQGNYTAASWTAMQTALNAAIVARDTTAATQAEIDAATLALRTAINALVPLGGGAAPPIGGGGGGLPSTPETPAQAPTAPAQTVVVEGGVVAELELTVSDVMELISKNLGLEILSDIAEITLDVASLASIVRGFDGDAEVRFVAEVAANPLADSFGTGIAIRLAVSVGGVYINDFAGAVTVTIPYSSGLAAADRDLLTVYHYNGGGEVREMSNVAYDGEYVTFTTAHFSIFIVSEWMNPFADVSRNSWYLRNVRFVHSQGIMSGVGGGMFAPSTNLSRAMLVTMLWRMEGMPVPVVSGGYAFSDVAAGSWYADAIAWASASGIVAGMGDGTFAPNASITREQFAVIMQNYAGFNGQNTGGVFVSDFADEGDISAWAVDAMAWANASGLITGRTLTTLAPVGTATRAEAASILQRFLEME